MLTQTLAIFHDAYRELNSKKLFWITLILSALLMAGFALLGIKDENTLTLLTVKFPMPMAKFAYKQIFAWVVVSLWFTGAAIVLALVSTVGLFPDFISSETARNSTCPTSLPSPNACGVDTLGKSGRLDETRWAIGFYGRTGPCLAIARSCCEHTS